VVAFRNSVKARPGLEYTSKVVSDFKTAVNRKDLETELAKVGEAKISSHSFNEDALAGIKTAVDELNWGPYASRMIILLTDAGPLPSSDPNASVKMDVRELADYAKTRGIWLSATHIQSPAGRSNHSEAEKPTAL
jgi:serine/threonine-protein kinase PpkA